MNSVTFSVFICFSFHDICHAETDMEKINMVLSPIHFLLNINDLLKNIDRSLVNIDKDVAKVYGFKSKDLEDQCLTVDPDHMIISLIN